METLVSAPSSQRIPNESGSLLEQIMEETRIHPGEEGYDVARMGVQAFIADLLKSDEHNQKINKVFVDRMIVEIDKKVSAQVDKILHHPEFRELEAAWRSLKILVDRTDFRENIKIELLSVSKQELLEDFENAPEVVQSGLYKQIYSSEYGQFGGEPVGAMIANFDFGPSVPDLKLLQYAASVGAMLRSLRQRLRRCSRLIAILNSLMSVIWHQFSKGHAIANGMHCERVKIAAISALLGRDFFCVSLTIRSITPYIASYTTKM